MTGSTHAAGGLAVGCAVGAALARWPGDLVTIITCAIFSLLGALLPDIDHPDSMIGRRLPGVSHATAAAFGHRGLVHTVWAAGGFGLLAFFLAGWLGGALGVVGVVGDIQVPATLATMAGALSHLALDSLTRSGVTPLSPLHPWHLRGPVRTGSVVDHMIGALTAAGWLAAVLRYSISIY